MIATARGVFDHRGGLLESAETNVSIYIPAGALPDGKKQEIYFKVCQDSKYMPPLDSNSGECLFCGYFNEHVFVEKLLFHYTCSSRYAQSVFSVIIKLTGNN